MDMESGAGGMWIFIMIGAGIFALMLPFILVYVPAQAFYQVGLDNGGNPDVQNLVWLYFSWIWIFVSIVGIWIWAINKAQRP
jgi:hypothetical protein